MQKRTFKPIVFAWNRDGAEHVFTLTGREAWALSRLIAAGAKGVTPMEEPTGPRWSAYVHRLKKHGVDIATVTERHGGAFPGSHARYVLFSDVRQLEGEVK